MATDIAIGSFTSDNAQLLVGYSIATQAASAFDVAVYRSADGTTLDARRADRLVGRALWRSAVSASGST